MELTGKSLKLVKKALVGYTVYCSQKAMRSSDKETAEIWDPELKDVQLLLKDVEINIERETPEYESRADGEKKTVDFFR